MKVFADLILFFAENFSRKRAPSLNSSHNTYKKSMMMKVSRSQY